MSTGKLAKMRFVLVVGPLITLCWAICLPTGHAALIPIDDFDYPNGTEDYLFTMDLTTGAATADDWCQSTAGTPLGGQRDILIEVDGGAYLPYSGAAMLGGDQQKFGVATSGGKGGLVITAQYDGVDTESGVPLNDAENLATVDLTDGDTNTRFQLAFDYLEAGDDTRMSIKIIVVGENGSSTYEGYIPEYLGQSVYNHHVAFDDAGWIWDGTGADEFPFDEADSVTFQFNGFSRGGGDDKNGSPVPNVDFQLDSLSAVPEPSTSAMVAIGILLFGGYAICRRRRRA